MKSSTDIFDTYADPFQILSNSLSYVIKYEELSWRFSPKEIKKKLKMLKTAVLCLPIKQNKETYVSIFTSPPFYRIFLFRAYTNQYDEKKIYTMPPLTKLLITWSHSSFLYYTLTTGFEQKHVFPLLNQHMIRNDVIDNNKNIKDQLVQEEEEKDVERFPMKVIGNVEKKGNVLGMFNHRYLELDCVNGLLKRFKSTETYPKNPM